MIKRVNNWVYARVGSIQAPFDARANPEAVDGAWLIFHARILRTPRATVPAEGLNMRVLIAGGSGLIGRHLARALLDGGHQPVILSRNADHLRREPSMWPYQIIPGDPTTAGRWQEQVDGCDVVVNVAGHNIFADRWNAAIKRKIRDSRVHSAENLVAAIKQARSRPKAYIQGSAIGYYGIQADQEITETNPSGTDFLAVVCRECEEVSHPIESLGVRRSMVRTGIVLAPGAGALKIMTPIFKLGPGLPIGSRGGLFASGQQWMSWIHIDDIAGIFRLAVENDTVFGPVNGTAPNPVRNAEFSKTFSDVLRSRLTPWRVFVPLGPPDQALKLLLGEVAGVVTTGQKVLPTKALALGYRFKYSQLADALRAIFTPIEPPAKPGAHPVAAGAGSRHHH